MVKEVAMPTVLACRHFKALYFYYGSLLLARLDAKLTGIEIFPASHVFFLLTRNCRQNMSKLRILDIILVSSNMVKLSS